MLKSDLRLNYNKLRNKLSADQIADSSITIANKLLLLPIWDFDNFHLFLPISEKNEIDTTLILSILQGKDKNVFLPKMQGDSLIHFLLTDNTVLIKNKLNVPEPVNGIAVDPSQIDVVFIPLLAFDVFGNRVGYGKGFYDRFLKECRTDVIKIGLSLFEAEKEITDVVETDIPLDYCVTPKKTYTFSPS
ncbi:MAG: 5-formyltetrahydrofolate cyclo-ligase [Maribacter sp.]